MTSHGAPGDAIAALERRLGHRFGEPALLTRALTHRSGGGEHNERLEFLGDAALGFVVAQALFEAHPDATERDLSLMRVSLVRNDVLAAIAREIGLGAALTTGAAPRRGGVHPVPSVLANALEAVLGAVCRDGGVEALRPVVARLFGARLDTLCGAPEADAKTRLQELAHARRVALPDYSVERVEGPDHARRFVVRCSVAELGVDAAAAGASRREAEQRAAGAVLRRLS